MTVLVAVDLSLDKLFEYRVAEGMKKELAVGQLLLVPFGHRQIRAFLMKINDEAVQRSGNYELKEVIAIVDKTPFFSPQLIELCKNIAKWTASPLESVLHSAIPAAVLKPGARAKEQLYVEAVPGKDCTALPERRRWLYEQLVRLTGGWMRQLTAELATTPASLKRLASEGYAIIEERQVRRDPLKASRILPSKPLELNEEQRSSLEMINAAAKPVLLFGVTGSGKTEVYLQAMARSLSEGKGAIIMVPEISLTPQTVQRFASRFGSKIAVLHSALSDGERYDEWHRIRSGEALVVVGPRSAVFAPVKNLGLIIVDEEHDTSYKQDEMPRYNARDVAVLRGKLEGARVVLGSATPSLESWHNVATGKYQKAVMLKRAGISKLPIVHIVDMNEEFNRGKIFSKELLEAISVRLKSNEQTILFLNRRGYSRSVQCTECGSVMTCPKCDVPYTYHRADSCLRCHICGGWILLPKACPECRAAALIYKGIGTQRAEASLHACFPRARILRMDADSTSRKFSHNDILGKFRRGEADILVGTQMIAKGLDFPNVTLVGVLNADSSLNMPDFRAGERTYQLLSQVSGRAGRSVLPGVSFIQTYNPDSQVVHFAAAGDFERFAALELTDRKAGYFPPYCHLAVATFRSTDASIVSSWAQMYSKSLAQIKELTVGEAVPCALEKADEWYRWQIIIRAKNNSSIVKAWHWISEARPAPKALRISLDVDAFNMI